MRPGQFKDKASLIVYITSWKGRESFSSPRVRFHYSKASVCWRVTVPHKILLTSCVLGALHDVFGKRKTAAFTHARIEESFKKKFHLASHAELVTGNPSRP